MTTTASNLHTTARHIITCAACGTAHLFIGTRYERNGQFCECLTTGRAVLAAWFGYRDRTGLAPVMPKAKAAVIRATVTDTRCDGACRSAKSDRCACECGGENHGANLGMGY
jgi:hypothetical protein